MLVFEFLKQPKLILCSFVQLLVTISNLVDDQLFIFLPLCCILLKLGLAQYLKHIITLNLVEASLEDFEPLFIVIINLLELFLLLAFLRHLFEDLLRRIIVSLLTLLFDHFLEQRLAARTRQFQLLMKA